MSSLQDRKTTGTVFNIQKYSVHDGPGIRTIVFLNGCTLACRWCSNPESQKPQPQLAYNEGRCLGLSKCVRCVEVCTKGAITEAPDGKITIDRTFCRDCDTLDCAHACPAKGLIIYGETKTVDEVLRVVEQDAIFYSRSGGGMTLSGGEPLFQKDFALALLREAKRRRIKLAIETCGNVPWETLAEAAPLLNNVLFDIKHIDSAKHKEWTGGGNERILENFHRLVTEFPDLSVLCRTPVIPGFNDDEETARAIGELIAPYPQVGYEMLPYHRLGTQKYTFLGRDYPMGDISLPQDVVPRLQGIVEKIVRDRRGLNG